LQSTVYTPCCPARTPDGLPGPPLPLRLAAQSLLSVVTPTPPPGRPVLTAACQLLAPSKLLGHRVRGFTNPDVM
jgi:hypothetical protein